MASSKEDKFIALKGFRTGFTEKARVIGDGLSSLVVDMGDDTVCKFYVPNKNGSQQNLQELRNEASILRIFNGTVGPFTTPKLIDEIEIYEQGSPISQYFLGHIHMTKLGGLTVTWDEFLAKANKAQIENHFMDVGALMASIKISAAQTQLTSHEPNHKSSHHFSWINDPELSHAINLCSTWMKQHQRSGFIHGDLCGHNIKVDNEGRVQGVLDFTFSGHSPNDLYDFHKLTGELLTPAIQGYESMAGEPVNQAVIEMTQILNLGRHIRDVIKSPSPQEDLQPMQQDFSEWVKSFAKDLALQ